MNESALFYTFSTVAQTLAAAFGILGAFVLFRLSGGERVLDPVRYYIRHNRGRFNPHEMEQAVRLGGAAAVNRIVSYADLDEHDSLWAAFDDAHKWYRHRDSILWWVRCALRLTLVVIGGSMVGIPVSPFLANFYWPALSLALAAVASAVGCLLIYFKLIGVLIRSSE